ncbi:hypothetical protein GTR02_19040 [Kineococcus sp. R8]|uniref:hypothetical protein n=1 Tax=Kineococcus siccus TaxID=2696567 RepID=UPI001412F63C|nr:hypothetical protein [Kineococcus siccus]NAZ83911.1 hypothetical protein [Kineococcus siccus]
MTWVLLVLAATASAAAGLVLARANPDARLPLWGGPPRRPRTYFVAYTATIVFMITAAQGLARAIGDVAWLLAVVAALVPLLVVTTVHNRRLPRRPVG